MIPPRTLRVLLNIPERDITNDDMVQEAYARFVFRSRLVQYESVILSDFYIRSSEILSVDYVSSDLHTNRCGGNSNSFGKWCQVLWDIRQRYGQEFTDKLLFYT